MIVLKEFPNSKVEPFIKTSDIAPHYNCIAWAFGDNSKWYEPDPFGFYYWPNDVPRQYSIPAYIKLYESIGFTICESGDLELGFEKIAVFAKNNIPTHAAKQLNDGVWSSKLGKNIDVSHTIFAIENGVYGQVSLFLKRLKSL